MDAGSCLSGCLFQARGVAVTAIAAAVMLDYPSTEACSMLLHQRTPPQSLGAIDCARRQTECWSPVLEIVCDLCQASRLMRRLVRKRHSQHGRSVPAAFSLPDPPRLHQESAGRTLCCLPTSAEFVI
jgi:hypothetical protein